jgi:hypothetical protein
MKKLLYKNGDAMKKIFIIGAIFLLFVSSSKVNADDSCNIIIDEEDTFLSGTVPVPTNETSRTQQATLEAINAIAQGITGTPPTWDGACYETGLTGLIWFTFCQNGDAMIYAVAPSHFPWDVVCGLDADNDDIVDSYDNCPDTYNLNQEDADNDGIGDACDSCPNDGLNDADGDAVCGDVDNCPDVSNSGQEDADSDTLGDVCDNDTVYGTFSGDVIEDFRVEIYELTCGGNVLIDNATTNTAGYYSIGNIPKGLYAVVPDDASYLFTPEFDSVKIPQAEIRPYDFTATNPNP